MDETGRATTTRYFNRYLWQTYARYWPMLCERSFLRSLPGLAEYYGRQNKLDPALDIVLGWVSYQRQDYRTALPSEIGQRTGAKAGAKSKIELADRNAANQYCSNGSRWKAQLNTCARRLAYTFRIADTAHPRGNERAF